MAVKEQPKQYESHGKTFDTRKEAKRHDELVTAKQALEDAQDKYQRVLAESAVTADGVPFEFGVFHDYYHIVKPWGSMPHVDRLSYVAWGWSVRDSDLPDQVEIADRRDDGKSRYVPIKELYADRDKAVAALLVAQREWLEERRREIEEFAEKVAAGVRVI
jgi:hypothetical protein